MTQEAMTCYIYHQRLYLKYIYGEYELTNTMLTSFKIHSLTKWVIHFRMAASGVRSTLGTFKCAQCPSTFLARADLVNHKKSAKHDIVRVICPYCTHERREFRRVGDLRFHVKGKHPKELQEGPKDLFTTRLVFYFAVDPAEYIKDHKPEDFDHPTSVYARDLVIKWVIRRSEDAGTWHAGWELSKGPSTPNLKRSATSLELLDVLISPGEIKAHFSLGEDYVMVKVNLAISEDFRGMDNLRRRHRALPQLFNIPNGSWKVYKSQEIKAESAALLGIKEEYISIVLRKPQPTFVPKVQRLDDPAVGSDAPATSPSMPTNGKDVLGELMKLCGVTGSPPVSPLASPSYIRSPTPIHLGELEQDELSNQFEDAEEPLPKDAVLDTESTGSTQPDSCKPQEPDLVSTSTVLPTADLTIQQTCSTAASLSGDSLASDQPTRSPLEGHPSVTEEVCTSMATSLPPLVLTTPAVPTAGVSVPVVGSNSVTGVSKVTFSLQGPESTIVSSADTLYEPPAVGLFQPCKPYKPTPTLSPDVVRQRAKTLLTRGCMPLLPPGRRDWSVVPEESIQLCRNLRWPPKGWQLLTRDQRSMAVEYAAMSVLQSEEATIFKDRLQLVQEFNFLVLPGSGQYKADTKAKARIYNHEVVAAIASGRDTSNLKEQMDLLACFSMKTDSTHEHLFKKIAHVPLRLL